MSTRSTMMTTKKPRDSLAASLRLSFLESQFRHTLMGQMMGRQKPRQKRTHAAHASDSESFSALKSVRQNGT